MHFHVEDIQDRLRPASTEETEAVQEALRALARPRMSGSDGAEAAARELRHRFEALGYAIDEIPFSFSAWPGRYGVPLVGGLYLVGTILAAGLLLAGRPGAAVVTLVLLLGLVAGLGFFAPTAIRRLPWERVETANWLVRRPEGRPRYLIMAHRDTKSQAVSTYLRTGAVVLAGAAWLALVVRAGLAVVNPGWRWTAATLLAGGAAVVAGGLLAASRASNDSPGALDNASGLAALLGIARRARDRDDIGFLVTDGEELGLAGAQAMLGRVPPVFGIINLDGLDDGGEFSVVEQHGWPRRGLAPHLTSALLCAAGALGAPARRRTLPPGVLVDHIPLADGGVPAVTVMRGSARSLQRVHRPEDDTAHLRGTGAAETVALVDGALGLLRESGRCC